MIAAPFGALALDALDLLPPSDVHTAAWWLGRLPWVAALVIVLAVLLVGFGRIEARALARKLESGAPTDPSPLQTRRTLMPAVPTSPPSSARSGSPRRARGPMARS